jgi:hypothetical protein
MPDHEAALGHLVPINDDHEGWERSVLRVHGPDREFLRHGAPRGVLDGRTGRGCLTNYGVLVRSSSSPYVLQLLVLVRESGCRNTR